MKNYVMRTLQKKAESDKTPNIKGQTEASDAYSITQVEETLKKKIGLSDAEIGGKYAGAEVTNLALVLGFLRGLGAQEVRVAKVNLADGVLPDKTSWKKPDADESAACRTELVSQR